MKFLPKHFILLFLLSFSSLSVAEHLSEPNMVYNKSSQLTVGNINKTIEVIRDPSKVIAASLGGGIAESMKSAIPSLSSKTSAEPLHDPTQMSGNFRQMLESYSPKNPVASTGSESNVVPLIDLLGKIFIPFDPLIDSQEQQEKSSVVLNVNEKTVHLQEGAKSSIVIQEHIITVSVEEITKHYVKIKLTPSNETLLLH